MGIAAANTPDACGMAWLHPGSLGTLTAPTLLFLSAHLDWL